MIKLTSQNILFTAILLVFSLFPSLNYAQDERYMFDTQIFNEPGKAALQIITHSLNAIKVLKAQGDSNTNIIKVTLDHVLIPHISIASAAEFALRKHWTKLTLAQQNIFAKYILKSVINDYADIIALSDSDLSQVFLRLSQDKIRRKGNKVIVSLLVYFKPDSKPVHFSLRMVKTNSWKIYDFIFTGYSIMASYRDQFDSKIKRLGLAETIKTISKSIN